MRVKALASGSSGNAFLVQAGSTTVLLDAGVGLTALARALAAEGTAMADLDCLLLTHEHGDHFSAVASLIRRHRLPVLGSAGTLACLGGNAGERTTLRPGSRTRVGDLAVTAFAVPHDGSEPVGYLLEHGEVRVCLATDLGHVPAELLSIWRGCDLLILEANHDLERLRNGPYPRALKERVASPLGHLSNAQAGDCLVACATSRPLWVWLAHLSATNNSPRCALRSIADHLRREGITTVQLQVALRDRPSLVWDAAEAHCQPRLF